MLDNVKFTRYISIRQRIGKKIIDILDDYPILWGICCIFIPYILILLLMGSLNISSYTPEDIKGHKIVRSVIFVERECGLKDTFIIHNIDTIPDVHKDKFGSMGHINTKGENWIGIDTDSEIKIENVENIEIIE